MSSLDIALLVGLSLAVLWALTMTAAWLVTLTLNQADRPDEPTP